MNRKNIFDGFGSSSSSDEEKSVSRRKDDKMEVNAPLKKQQPVPLVHPPPPPPRRRRGERFENDDDEYEIVRREDGFYESKEEDVFDDRDLEEFSDLTERKKVFKKNIDLVPIDHSRINYKKIDKKIRVDSSFTSPSVSEKRRKLGIQVSGFQTNHINPIDSFNEISNDDLFLQSLRQNHFETPTVIQSQSIPIALEGRDIIAVSETGSGKTLAFIIPSILHYFRQNRMVKKASPIVLILAPTRELSIQIFRVITSITRHFQHRKKVGVVLLVGGVDKNVQFKELRKGVCDFVVGTPGRVIDLFKMKAFFLQDVTMMILDEVDRMFEMGFEIQMKALMGQIRLDRQCLFFSATLHPRVQSLVQDKMVNPVEVRTGQSQYRDGQIISGGPGLPHPVLQTINPRIQQRVILVNSEDEKFRLFQEIHLPFFLTFGSVLVFVKSRVRTEELSTRLCELGFIASSLHGEKNVEEREEVLLAFRNQTVRILVSTDVASRGLDIPNIQTVVNYDIPKNLETYIHRIGRTGRQLTNERNALRNASQVNFVDLSDTNDQSNKKKKRKRKKKKKGFSKRLYDGNSVTFLDRHKEAYFAPNLVYGLEAAGQEVGNELFQLAMRNQKFRNLKRNTNRQQQNKVVIGRNGESGNDIKSGNTNNTQVRPPPRSDHQESKDVRYYSSKDGQIGVNESEFVKHVRRQYQHSFVYSNVQVFDDTEEIEVIPPKNEEGGFVLPK